MFDTIAAISTGLINQPISIIRISGPEAFALVKKIFSGPIGDHKTITYGFIQEKNHNIDEVLVAWFEGPNSFTGEDIVEINAHGGTINSNKILELCLVNGARLAEKGEFSRRAFLNGKMDLIKAEAIHDLIFAKTENQSFLAAKKFDGQTTNFISNLKSDLLNIIAIIETNIDYPEYDDIEILTQKNLLPKLKIVKNKMQKVLDISKNARYISKGIKVAIIGQPNTGKSTLLNALINENKAIVTNIPGTTRDVVEGQMQINGILIHLIDTAGIHNTEDVVEKKGIAKSIEKIQEADLVIHLIDPEAKSHKMDQHFLDLIQHKVHLNVFSKKDLHNQDNKKAINISAKNNDIQELIDAISNLIPKIELDSHNLITNARQLSLLKKSDFTLKNAIDGLNAGFNPDEIIIDVRKSWEDLANITGEANNEKLLDEMFKNFCLGK